MNKKGFTLIELLGVIIILSLIMIFAVPKISDSVKNQTQKTDKLTEDIIYKATNLYIEDNKDEYRNKNGAIYCISLNELSKLEYLSNTVNNDIINTKTVKVISKKNFNYELVDNDKCVENFPPLEPNLHNNSLIPVVYKNENWVVVDKTDKSWYDYENQEWANAVILKSGVNKNIGDTIDVSNEVQGMFVWIPRYEYKIEGTYGTHLDGTVGTQSLPGEIKVNFIGTSKTQSSDGYIIHPAFTFGDEILSGIWVGKFETTGTAESPTILPSVTSLRNQNISTQFATAQKFNQYLSNGDSHMSKNSEWGAVAYLSQSIYGKYGNPNYTGEEKEVAINNCSSYITGVGGDTVSAEASADTCGTNTYETEKGQSASTTGNITGVYDMSGGAYERVMGVYNRLLKDSGFVELPEPKYYNNYLTDNIQIACDGKPCYGCALSETSKWYNDYSTFLVTNYPWINRSGCTTDTKNAGIFMYHYNSGAGYNRDSFRIVIS